MKPKVAIIAGALLLIAAAASMAEDHKYRPLFFVNSYTEYDAGNTIGVNKGYYDFAEMIRSYGFRVAQDSEPNMTTEWLEENDIDVLLLPVPYSPLEAIEIQALREFIKGGGTVVFLLSSHPFFFNDHKNISSFTVPYGITVDRNGSGGIRGNPPGGSGMWRPNKVPNVKVWREYATLDVNSHFAQTAVLLEDDSILTAFSTRSDLLGSGRLVVHGDAIMFYRGNSSEDSLYKEGNAEFARNFILYCAGIFDVSPVKVKLKPKAPAAGEAATVVVQVKNVYHLDSAPVALRVSIVAKGGTPSADSTVLANVTLPAIKVGKKTKQKIKVKLPANLQPGDYYIIAEIDPGLTSPDIYTENNRARSKAYTIQ